MSSFKGFRVGKKLPNSDVQRRMEAYKREKEKYDKLSLPELKELYPTLGGSYRLACEASYREKYIEGQVKLKEMETSKESIPVEQDINPIPNSDEEKDDMEISAGGAIEGE